MKEFNDYKERFRAKYAAQRQQLIQNREQFLTDTERIEETYNLRSEYMRKTLKKPQEKNFP